MHKIYEWASFNVTDRIYMYYLPLSVHPVLCVTVVSRSMMKEIDLPMVHSGNLIYFSVPHYTTSLDKCASNMNAIQNALLDMLQIHTKVAYHIQ